MRRTRAPRTRLGRVFSKRLLWKYYLSLFLFIYIYLYLLIYFCKIKVEESWVNLIKLLLLNLLNFVRGLKFNRKIALNFLSPPPSFIFSRRNQRFRSLEKFKRKKSRDYLKHDLIIKSPLDINSHRNVMSKLNRT